MIKGGASIQLPPTSSSGRVGADLIDKEWKVFRYFIDIFVSDVCVPDFIYSVNEDDDDGCEFMLTVGRRCGQFVKLDKQSV